MNSTRKLVEPQTHSFLVRFWLEKASTQDNQAVWRGHITHVASGTRRYVEHPDKIIGFTATYLYQDQANNQPDHAQSWRHCIGRWFTRIWRGRTGRDWHL